jgi:hypothetical protein
MRLIPLPPISAAHAAMIGIGTLHDVGLYGARLAMQFYAARKSAAKDAHKLSAQLAHLRSSFRTVCACDTHT